MVEKAGRLHLVGDVIGESLSSFSAKALSTNVHSENVLLILSGGKKVISLNQAPFNLLKWVGNHAQKLIDVYLWTCILHCGSASPGTKERH